MILQKLMKWPHVLLIILAILLLVTTNSPGQVTNRPRHPFEPTWVAKLDERPFVAAFRDGTLIGCFERTPGSDTEVAAIYSHDSGRTWSAPETQLKLPVVKGAFHLYLTFVDRDDNVHLFFLNDAGTYAARANAGPKAESIERHLDIWHTKTIKQRKDWQPVRMIHEGFASHLNSVIQLRSGRLVVPFASLTKRTWGNRGSGFDAYTYMGQYDCTTIYSDDGGETWRRSPATLKVETPTISTYGAVEPVIIELKDGRVWMLMRTQRGRFWESFSRDGVEWSEPKPTDIFSSDSPAGLVRLKDGRIALFWNACLRASYAFGGRPVLHVAISEDEGRTWRGYREVARDPLRNQPPPPSGDWGTAYPFPIVTREGKILLRTGQGQGRNFLLLVDPDWVYETHQRSDLSSDLDRWSMFATRGVELTDLAGNLKHQALAIRKTDADWPAAAVWNFPMGAKGQLRLRLMLRDGFQGALIGLTDHYSAPFDAEDQFFNLYNFRIGAGGQLARGGKLALDHWLTLEAQWDTSRRNAHVFVDGRPVAILPLLRDSYGACYLRIRSTAPKDEAGLLVDSVDADTSRAWTK
jgi:BNR repeat-like domain